MSETRSEFSFKVTEFLQESGDLENNHKSVFRTGLVVHFKAFDSIGVFRHWIETFVLEDLPVSAEFKLIIGIEQQQKVFDAGNDFFELKVRSASVKMVR